MEILENGDWKLDTDDQELVACTLATAILPIDEGLAHSDQIHTIAELACDFIRRRHERQPELTMTKDEADLLENALTVARDNFHYALGIVGGVQLLLRTDFETAVDLLESQEQDQPVFKKVGSILKSGASALELSDIVKVHKLPTVVKDETAQPNNPFQIKDGVSPKDVVDMLKSQLDEPDDNA